MSGTEVKDEQNVTEQVDDSVDEVVGEQTAEAEAVDSTEKNTTETADSKKTVAEAAPKTDEAAKSDKADITGKIFVGGIAGDASQTTLKDFFTQFGEVKEAQVVMTKGKDRTKGFGFVTFVEDATVQKVLDAAPLKMGERPIEAKRCVANAERKEKPANKKPAQTNGAFNTKPAFTAGGGNYHGGNFEQKIFIGGLSPETTEESVKTAMSKFGAVEEVRVMKDKLTGKSRCFGFVTFENKLTVSIVTQKSHYEIDGKQIEVKRAEQRPDPRAGGAMPSRGGRGGMRGGMQVYNNRAMPMPYGAAPYARPTPMGVYGQQAYGGGKFGAPGKGPFVPLGGAGAYGQPPVSGAPARGGRGGAARGGFARANAQAYNQPLAASYGTQDPYAQNGTYGADAYGYEQLQAYGRPSVDYGYGATAQQGFESYDGYGQPTQQAAPVYGGGYADNNAYGTTACQSQGHDAAARDARYTPYGR
ncbi:hypothetical protein SARC_02329 [Sphaeroforma arctica JP610]|uniref:RRM domain-containing protein n=1 Tax=Sphaeroforma arctica JP610 TaxID=667725 RepID=A0A0L0G8Y6_9EUKA|nr:hypothetical protein SARC_02329 [Sphaeroforma arctica JP610]KNC85492.1 hypothetical protein SARC_02329 [Sphaeroforma arctica JP610]|eukprot:XP_014159394.1 hypothetical protein SARC_02329 [Sphaeroforma arctica JP610]